MNQHSPLATLIQQKIISHPYSRITFAEYMDLALYHPEYGYYTNKRVNLGRKGDFFTSPHLGPDFGELLALQFVQMWEILGQPNPFTLVEMGAGQGILATDILKYLLTHHVDFFNHLQYIIIERSPTLIAQQQQRLQQEIGVSDRYHWYSWEQIPSQSITGCLFSNELVDAFPVHKIIIKAGKLQEIYVTTTKRTPADLPLFTEIIDEPSTQKLAEYLNLVEIDLTNYSDIDEYRSEVNLAALDWMDTVNQRLQRGYVLTIDYGYTAKHFYHPSRQQGTLKCYYRHQHHDHPYIYVGEQDLTSHVNFTALEKKGELSGLERLGFQPQEYFLMALGLGERLRTLTTQPTNLQTVLNRRDALHQLINPTGLGGFGVLVQGKGLSIMEKRRSLTGFNIPMF